MPIAIERNALFRAGCCWMFGPAHENRPAIVEPMRKDGCSRPVIGFRRSIKPSPKVDESIFISRNANSSLMPGRYRLSFRISLAVESLPVDVVGQLSRSSDGRTALRWSCKPATVSRSRPLDTALSASRSCGSLIFHSAICA